MKVLNIGKYTVGIEGEAEFPGLWSEYLGGGTPEHIIELSYSRLGKCSEDGIFFKDSPERSTCYFFGQAKYALLRPENENRMRLLILKNDSDALKLGLSHALMLLLSRDCIGLHCVTVRIADKLIALSAPSGTGKTTLSNLLEKYSGAEIINGDFALLALTEDGRVMFEPTPFCGSSGICKNLRLPLDGIVFLSQSPENSFSRISPAQALVPILSNIYVPEWLPERANDVRCNAVIVARRLPISTYAFAPTKEAAETFLREILAQ